MKNLKKSKEINVSNHAIKRFKERCFYCFDWTDERIRKTLESVARHGKVLKKCPGNAYEVVFQGMIVRITYSGNRVVVITYLGNRTYQKWYRKVG